MEHVHCLWFVCMLVGFIGSDRNCIVCQYPPSTKYGFQIFNTSLKVRQNLNEFLVNMNPPAKRKLIYEQIRHCPFTDICAFKTGLVISYNKTTHYWAPCCMRCTCDAECGVFTNCCPDIIPEEVFVNKLQESSDLVCIPTAMKTEAAQGVYGINTCNIENSSSGCLMTNERYTEANIFDDIPVTDLQSNLTYRNKQCALCNSVPEERMFSWIPHLWCESQEHYYNISSATSLISALYETNGCNIRYKQDISKTKRCLVLKSECNATGLWQTKDAFVEWACSFYISPVEASDKMMYKNVFCALCNGFIGIENVCPIFDRIPGKTDDQSLTALMSFKSTLTESNHCPTGFIINTITGFCLEAHCSILRRLTNNMCEPIILQVEGLRYKLSLRIFPKSQVSLLKAFDIPDKLVSWLKQNILFDLKEYQLFIISHPQKFDEQLTNDTLVIFLDMSITFQLYGQHLPENMLQEFIEMMNNNTFRINTTARNTDLSFTFYVRDDSGNATETAKLRLSEVDVNVEGALCVGIYTYPRSVYAISESKSLAWFDTVTRTFTVPFVTFSSCVDKLRHDSLSVLQFNTCPFVSISFDDIPWTESTTSITFVNTSVSLSLFEFIYQTPEKDIISVCADIYFQLFVISEANVLSNHLGGLVSLTLSLLDSFLRISES